MQENSLRNFILANARNFLALPPLLSPNGLQDYLQEFSVSRATDLPTLFTPNASYDLETLKALLLETINPLGPQNRRLGKYFENLVAAYLNIANPGLALHRNIQIKSEFTPGELDFVFSCENSLTHLEVAIKFYLFVPSADCTLSCFVGPGLKDRFDLKLAKLLLKQLCHKIPDELLPVANTIVIRKLWLTGMLFYPWQLFSNVDFPNFRTLGLDANHRKGWWMPKSIADSLMTNFRFLPVPKYLWLAPNLVPIHKFMQIQNSKIEYLDLGNLQIESEPVFCLRVDSNDQIIDRGFIVPEGYLPQID